jgi:hypothetical protein
VGHPDASASAGRVAGTWPAQPGHHELDVAALAGLPAAVRRRALRLALVAAGCPAGALGRDHVVAVDALVTAWSGQGPIALPGDVRAVRRGRLLQLDRAPSRR